MKTVLFAVLCAAQALSAGAGEWVSLREGNRTADAPLITTTSIEPDAVIFEVDVPGVAVEDVRTPLGFSSGPALPGEGFTVEIGAPRLPLIRRLVEVPQGARLRIEVLAEEVSDHTLAELGIRGEIVPVQEPILKTEDGLDRWTYRRNEERYAEGAFRPDCRVRIAAVEQYRGHRAARLEILPVSYHPVGGIVRVWSRLRFALRMEGGDLDATRRRIAATRSEAFEETYSRLFLNYGMFGGWSEAAASGGLWDGLLVISDPAFYVEAENLARWRRKTGYRVEHVDTGPSGTDGSDTDSVKAFIQQAYDTWTDPGLGFVLLVGDTAQIATPSGTYCSGCASDSDYACLDGPDNVHDVYLGRISVETPAQAAEVFSRFLQYAKADFAGSTGWIEKACFSSSCDSTYNAYRTHEACLAAYTKPNGYSGTFYPGGEDPGGDLIRCIEDYGGSGNASGDDVVAAINEGRSLVTYSGHCGQTSWSGPYVGKSDMSSATSGEMSPFMTGHCCVAHSIDYSVACMGEAALREVAVGYFGSSNNSMWGEDDYLQLAWFDQIFEGGRHRMGVYTINGLIDMYNNYSSGSLNYYMDMEIFGGDPTMELFTEIPASLNVTHDAALIIGQSDFTVTVRRGGGLLAGARVCLTKTDGGDDVQAFGLTDASGTVTLTLSPAPASVGTMDVTVTAVNAVPYEGAVEIIVPDGPYLTHDSHAVDDSAGNGDGIVNPGETVFLSVTLRNIGADAASGVTGALSTASPLAAVTDGAASFPDIPVSGTGQSLPDHFAFQVGSGASDGDILPFSLAWTAAGGYSAGTSFSIPVCDFLVIGAVSVTEITGDSARITWATNLPSTSRVLYGTSAPPASFVEDGSLVTDHDILLTGLVPSKTHYFGVASSTPGCYAETDDNGGSFYAFTTLICSASAPDSSHTDQDVPFLSSSTAAGGTVYHTWDFGDGTPLVYTQNATHAYREAGIYQWNYSVVADDETCSDWGTIAVTDTCSIACSASASPGSGSAPLQVFFSGGGETDHCTEDLRHFWTFGDGTTSPEADPVHVYEDAGSYSWTYSASADDAVCTKTGVVTVAEAPPCSVTCSAEASAAAGTAPLAVSFSSTASAAGCDSAVVSLWDFGDGSVSTQENPSHSYGQAGTYAWTFLAEANGVTCSESGSVVVEPPSCVLQCSASGLPAAGEAPHTVHFTSTLDASGCDGEVTTLWVFGDGATALDASPEHEYTAAGAYDWTFTAEVQGQTCTASGTVTVTEACVLQCDASAAADALTVSFTAQVDASGCPEPPETTWDFGDGATGSGLTAEHAYAQPGAYAWALTAEAGGVTCSREGTVVVTAPCALTCSASADPGAGAAPLSVQFSASAQGENCTGSQAFSWDFGDGTAGSGAGPTHVYAFPGTYDWSVTASLDGATCVSGGTVTAEEGVPGDLDGDGAVSVGEIQAVINMFLEGGTVDPGADCDGDGAISLGELQNVINCFLGLPCGC